MANENILREWAPLTDLLSKLPIKSQNGLFSQEIKITCLDVLPEFIALGSNLGIVFWYDRKKRNLERLRCENANSPITVVKIISTVDFMVACGNNSGNISIFQIPKSHPNSLPESLKPKNKQVERYTVSDLHKSPISAIEWSKNGMKLFSGDKNGGIVLTELDFYMHICKSVEILNEAYEVVQISYNQQRLLISTTYRSIICQKLEKWKVCQVGKKDRKVLGNYGGIIHQNSVKTNDSVLYCTRPGLRIWISDIEGNVQKTLLFKELLSKECPEVPLINPISRNLRLLKPQKEPCFSILLPFNDNLLVTHNGDVIYILDPIEMIILYTISHLRGVLNIATYKDEIFVLEEDRSIIRISHKSEPNYGLTSTSPIDNTFSPISSSIKDLTMKIQTSSIMSAIPPLREPASPIDVNVHTDESLIMKAEEATESPIKTNHLHPEVQKKFDDIGKQEFNEKILFKKYKKKKISKSASTNSLSSNSSEEKDLSFTRPTIMNLSAVGVLPDLRSPESIKNDIEYKERILADVLNLDKIKINLDELKGDTRDCGTDSHTTKKIFRKAEPEYSQIVLKDTKVISNNSVIEEPKSLKSTSSNVLNNKIEYKKKSSSSPQCTSLTQDDTKSVKHKPNHISNGQKEYNMKPSSSSSPPNSILAPGYRNIPNEWKLTDIQLNTNKDSASDTSLTDWEII